MKELLFACLSLSQAVVEEYSTNAICRKNNCINPVFPALQGVVSMQELKWECAGSNAREHLDFCAGAVHYDFSLISKSQSNASNTTLAARVKELDDLASTAYFYHLAGMNLEAWDFSSPSKGDDCIQAVWKMACFTYLPKSQAFCKSGDSVSYLMPCGDVCRSYTSHCAVECCDESVQCTDSNFAPPYESFTGYSKAHSPSSHCTGSVSGAGRAGVPLRAVLVLALLGLLSPSFEAPRIRGRRFILGLCLVLVAVSLQGCNALGIKDKGAWESKPGYMTTFTYVPAAPIPLNKTASTKTHVALNSCYSEEDLKCSGHGTCMQFAGFGNETSVSTPPIIEGGAKPILFCQCERDYFDPECRTRRKSQRTAFALSCFAGFLGLDRFYLGQMGAGSAKLASLGGAGIWWARDVVWIGSGPIYTAETGRLAADLPHWLFVLLAIAWACLVSYLIFGVMGFIWHQHRLLEKALLQAERGLHDFAKQQVPLETQAMLGMPRRASYHLLAPPPGPEDYYGTMAAAAPQVKLAAYKNPMSSFFCYAKANEDPKLKESGAFRRPTAAVPPPRPDPVPSDLL